MEAIARDTVVEILKPHPWHGKKAVITEGPLENGSYGCILKGNDGRVEYLSINPKLLKILHP